MPKAIEDALKRQADRNGLKGKRRNAFIYGTLRKKFGWKPKRERKA